MRVFDKLLEYGNSRNPADSGHLIMADLIKKEIGQWMI
jgi:hypothetical protein